MTRLKTTPNYRNPTVTLSGKSHPPSPPENTTITQPCASNTPHYNLSHHRNPNVKDQRHVVGLANLYNVTYLS